MSNKNEINKDLIYFKNEILFDIRKLEERFNLKLTEQSIMSSEQYDSFENKLTELNERINKVQSLILDSIEQTEEIKAFRRFKTKAEENFNRINLKIISFQKENEDLNNNIEKTINENLRYPGIIGKNGKFLNFRYFIDYTLKSLNDLNEFRDEIRLLNFNEFKRKINKDINDFRFSLSDNYKNSIRLIGNNFKEFEKKVENLTQRNNKNMEENEAKFEKIKNNFNKYL